MKWNYSRCDACGHETETMCFAGHGSKLRCPKCSSERVTYLGYPVWKKMQVWKSKIDRVGKPYGKSHRLGVDGHPLCSEAIRKRGGKWLNAFRCAWGPEEPAAQRCGLCKREP